MPTDFSDFNVGDTIQDSHIEDAYTAINNLELGLPWYAASSAGTDDYIITLSPVPTGYTSGMLVNIKTDVANTGPATINVNSLGAKSIKRRGSEDLATGDIAAGQIVSLIYDGTNFQLLGAGPPNAAGWNDSGSVVHTTHINDSVVIGGSTSKAQKLHLITNSTGVTAVSDTGSDDFVIEGSAVGQTFALSTTGTGKINWETSGGVEASISWNSNTNEFSITQNGYTITLPTSAPGGDKVMQVDTNGDGTWVDGGGGGSAVSIAQVARWAVLGHNTANFLSLGPATSFPVSSGYNNAAAILITRASTLKNFTFMAHENTLTTANTTIEVHKNEASASVTLVVAAGGTSGANNSDTVSVAAGDRVYISCTTDSGGSGSVTHPTVAFEIEM